MSTTPSPTKKPSAASRYFFILLIGLVIGAIATVMAMRALDARRDHFPDAVMTVMAAHSGQLKGNIDQNRCAATDTIPHLNALRVMANDIEPAFKDYAGDQRFAQHASKLRATMDELIASPPLNCAGVKAAADKIGESCKACHQDFRN